MTWSLSYMQSMNTQEYKRNLLDIYLDEILKTIKPSDIIPHLITLKEFDYDVQSDILAKEKTDRRKAATMLTTKLRICQEAEWFDLFKDGLDKAGYEKLFKQLSLQDIKNEDVFANMIRTIYPSLIKSFRASEVLPILYSRRTISETDHEEIMAEPVEIRRAQTLLTRLPKKEGWFYDLVYSFMETKSVKALRNIDPSLVDADSEESLMKMLDKLGFINEHRHPTCSGFYESDPKKMKELAEDKQDDEEHDTIEESSMHFSVPKNDLSVDAQPSCENSENSGIIDLKEDHVPQSSLCSNDMNINVNRKETSFKQIEKPIDKRLRNAIKDLGDPSSFNISLKSSSIEATAFSRSIRDTSTRTSGSSYTFGDQSSTGPSYTFTDQTGNLNQLSQLDNKTQSKLINTANLAPNESSRSPSSAAASSHPSTSSTVSSQPPSSTYHLVPDSSSDKPVVLRGYQKELAEKAISGKNCIIVAPTGSGKTHVALEISKAHFNSETREPRKIVFFVPKVPLVSQQYDLFYRNMEDNCKIYKLHGEADSDTPISDVIKNNDVLIMTPQVLVNALRDGEVESLSVFTLMIFDECHHATKEHPYNEIMSIFREAMFSHVDQRLPGVTPAPVRLPQIVGLTASTGVGKARSVNEASEHILQLCANLAALEICTVQGEENKKELEKYANRPIEDSVEVEGRKEDPFHLNISQIMKTIERRMMQRPELPELLKEIPALSGIHQPPDKRGSLQYVEHISRLKKPIATIYSQNVRRFFVSCREHLEVYNSALLINSDCRCIDALKFIKNKFSEFSTDRQTSANDDTDCWLIGLFTENERELESISRSPRNENPKLKFLEEKILSYYEGGAVSLGIIFCRTRDTVEALTNWMKETPSLAGLNPSNAVGTSKPSSIQGEASFGMTRSKLDDVLKYFKDQKHKVLVATSVVEEGLDVQKCNYVIRYEHVTNDIARVQARGRARANQAEYLLVGETGRGTFERDQNNEIREGLMYKAIDKIYAMRKPERDQKILELQIKAKAEKDIKVSSEVIRDELKRNRKQEGDYELRCLKCDNLAVYSSDIRVIKKAHHVVFDPTFKSRVNFKPHSRPKKYDEWEKKDKIVCKHCNKDWGIKALFNGIPLCVLKPDPLIFIHPNNKRMPYSKWKDVPFTMEEMSSRDLEVISNSVDDFY